MNAFEPLTDCCLCHTNYLVPIPVGLVLQARPNQPQCGLLSVSCFQYHAWVRVRHTESDLHCGWLGLAYETSSSQGSEKIFENHIKRCGITQCGKHKAAASSLIYMYLPTLCEQFHLAALSRMDSALSRMDSEWSSTRISNLKLPDFFTWEIVSGSTSFFIPNITWL